MSGWVTPRIHAWHIEEREYARHEQRRGRRHAYERIEPLKTALVVVDMVPFFVEEMEYCRGIVPNIERLASCLRSAGGTVAWVLPGPSKTMTLDAEFFGPEVADVYRRSGGKGPLRERLWHEFEVSDDDILVEKSASSAFFPGRSPLPAALDARVGSTRSSSPGQSPTSAASPQLGTRARLAIEFSMVADANAARRDEDHNATLYTVYRSFGDVRPTIDVLGLIQAATR